MRYWFILILLCIGAPLSGQDTIPTENGTKEVVTPKKGDAVKTTVVFKSGDSTYDNAPLVNYNFVEPRSYVIKDIDVKEINGKAVQKALVVLYSGLSIGQTIKVPGQEIPKAIENIWKRNYFSDIQVYFLPTSNEGEIVVQFLVTEQPKLNGYRFLNVSNSQAKSLKEECDLRRGMYITPNLINRTIQKIEAFYLDKGHFNIQVSVKRPTAKNKDGSPMVGFENFDFVINKGPKVRVYDFVFNGNKEVEDKELRKAISTIKRRRLKWNIFSSSKYTEDKFKEGKAELITYYQKLGYRDARVVSDSISMFNDKRILVHLNLVEGNKYRFRSIKWKGNEKYRTSFLDTLLGIHKGDVFNQSLLDERLFSNPGGFDIQTLYMDAGYLFFNMMPVEVGVFNDSIDLEIRINEGPQAVIGRVTWSGNTKTSDRVILREVRTKPGNKFSRSDIQRTMRDLAAIGLFDPEQLNVNPKPNPADGTVDIEYKLVEKPSDQIELSGGWGGNGFSTTPTLIGTAGIVLNNFSSRKLFNTRLWNPIPSGDGQKLSLRAQSNGTNYQGYTFSFTEPWLGGYKPTSFSVSIFHTVNSFDFRQKDDPLRQVFYNTGINLSVGKRLKWPDDFFSIQYSLSFQQYRMQNMDGGFYGFPTGFQGISYNPSAQIVLTRTSISDPIYPTSGSKFTTSIQATPPLSLMNNKDYTSMELTERYKWAEFYKFKLDAEWYTPIYKKLVLTAKTRFGFLGYYNKDIGPTFFERFQVGGAGIFGFNIAATEIISQRGYDNYTISQTAMGSSAGAPIFNKFTVELRQAITTGQTATVYGLAFLEAGDAWSDISKYNPFQLKRAAGVGVRLFMPMFGLIGLDYAWGFDYRDVPRSGDMGQVHFFIGQQF
jgi:outer membrane protein insertion porin family